MEMAEVWTSFRDARLVALNAPASDADIERVSAIRPQARGLCEALHRGFDGERDWGALLSGWKLLSIREIEAASRLIDDLTDDGSIPMEASTLLPWISTTHKTDIVLTPDGTVAELDYERQRLLPWCTSLDSFSIGLVRLSLQRDLPQRRGLRERWTELAAGDLDVLRRLDGFLFPLCNRDQVERDLRQ